MKYSVIIPAFRCESTLEGTVGSILRTGLPDYEILLIDDGSTDGTPAVCDALAAEYPQVRVIHQDNAGASAARNRGIREARGENILFMDADDTIDADALRDVLEDPRCGQADLTVFGLTFDYYWNGVCYRRDPLYFKQDGILDEDQWGRAFAQMYADNALSPVWNKVFRRSILLEHQLELNTDMFLYEDFEFVLRYLRHCDRIWNVPRGIYHYRQSEDEGNAGRRLARIDCLSVFLKPVEAALDGLDNVGAGQKETVLVSLFQVLAREKISVSDLKQIRRICEDYAAWYGGSSFTAGDNDFHRQLMGRKAVALMLRDKKTALRHRIAVWAKAHHLYKA